VTRHGWVRRGSCQAARPRSEHGTNCSRRRGAVEVMLGEQRSSGSTSPLPQQRGKPRAAGMLAELLDARAALVQPRQRHQVMLLVVPLAANRDMGLDEPGVIDQTLAPAQIDVGLEAIQGQLADTFGPPRIPVVGRIPRSAAPRSRRSAPARPGRCRTGRQGAGPAAGSARPTPGPPRPR
jgi:hypothetical protein